MKKIQTDKFTQTTLSIRWFVPIEKKTITAWNLLLMMLGRTTEKFSTRQELSGRLARAYGASAGYGLSGIGQTLRVEFRMTFLREDLINEEGYTEQLIELFDQLLHHPYFGEDSLAEMKYLLKNTLIAASQDPDARAAELAFSAFKDSPSLSVNLRGSLDDVDDVTIDDVKALYEQLTQAKCQSYMCGEISKDFEDVFTQAAPGEILKASWKPAAPMEYTELTEEKDISQSAFCEVYTTGIDPKDPDYFPFLVLNSLLGASSVSLLFETVREQNSLCYSISSNPIRFDGLLLIAVGADSSNIAKARELIKGVLDDVRAGKVDPATYTMVVEEMVDSTRGLGDSRMSMIDQDFLNDILQRPLSAEDNIRKVQAVTIEDVARAARRLQPAVCACVLQKKAAENPEEYDGEMDVRMDDMSEEEGEYAA